MKITKKITSVVLALLLAVSAFAGLAITASAAAPEGTYTLTITKYQTPETESNKETLIGTTNGLSGTEDDDPNAKRDENGDPLYNYKPLKGVTFTMAKVGNLDEQMTLEQAATKYATLEEAAKTSKTTGDDGKAVLTTDVAGLYYVEETAHPASVTTKSAPFMVYLPMTQQNVGIKDNPYGHGSNNDGKQWFTNVYVYPKNLTTLGAAKLTKTVNNAAYDASKIKTAPVFELYAGADKNGTLLATYTLPSSTDANGSATIATGLDAKYGTVKVAVKDGVMVVDGLPTNTDVNGDPVAATYCFVEKSGITLVENDTLIPFNATPKTFTVTPGTTKTIDIDAFNTAGDTAATDTFENLTLDNSKEPGITKTVKSSTGTYVNGNGGSFSIGDKVEWKVAVDIPADISGYTAYSVTDKLDTVLDMVMQDYPNQDKPSITVEGAGIDKMQEGADYTLTYTEATREIKFEILKFKDETWAQDKAWAEGTLTFTINTKINETATAVTTGAPADGDADTAIDNQATLAFTNAINPDGKTIPSDHPYVYTAGLNIVKYETGTTNALAGVKFNLYRVGEGGNLEQITNFDKDEDGVYYPSQYGEFSDGLETDATGSIKIKGLATGNYQLEETLAAEDFQLLAANVDYTVTDTTFANPIAIYNVRQPQLPITGGMGTILFTVAGLVLAGGAVFAYVYMKKRSKKEEA